MASEALLKKLADRSQTRCTLLGVGAVSKNCVDVAIEVANSHKLPLMIIASRRQIDSDDFGGGYVNRWSTEEFAQYVRTKDKGGMISLVRDHGGPWQNLKEWGSSPQDSLNLADAMESAKKSYLSDIKAGFDFLHIDPSEDPSGPPSADDVLERVLELYGFCCEHASSLGKKVFFEIGTEEQGEHFQDLEQFEETLNKITQFCDKNKFQKPSFIVAQTGTKVKEMQNTGEFTQIFENATFDSTPKNQIVDILKICQRYGVFLKEHNADYLSDHLLQWHPRLGIHAANVAPEFAVAETCAFLKILEAHALHTLKEEFIQLAVRSKKWEKWMLSDSKAKDEEKALIAGHYIYSTPEFGSIYARASEQLNQQNVDLNRALKQAVEQSIQRYIRCFQLN